MKWISLLAIVIAAIGVDLAFNSIGGAMVFFGVGLLVWRGIEGGPDNTNDDINPPLIPR